MKTWNKARNRNASASLTATASLAALVLLSAASARPLAAQDIGQGGNTLGYDMAPETNLSVVQAAVQQIPHRTAPGPVEPTWNSLQQNYTVPDWFVGAKFGIFLHFGIFSVPAHHTEWYEKFMYAGGEDSTLKAMGDHETLLPWHTEHYGPPDKFGYKDFIPMFRAEKFDPDAWALLFKRAGARYVVPGAQHHENFAMWDSQVTPFNAARMGPKRDIIGDLAKSVRAQGMKLGLANHGIENFQFINPPADLAARLKAEKVDLYDPKWADFYNYADRSDAACEKFLVNWYQRNMELIDKYRPDLIYFDNGIDQRYLDPLKLNIAAYYYNRARSWGKQVSFTTKKAAFAPSGANTETIGSIIDFEGGPPKGIRTGAWEVDRPIGDTWGYTTGMHISSASTVIGWLADTASKNGTLLLNVSPMSDGTIPEDQQQTLLGVGKWLETNGEAIYDTHAWTQASTQASTESSAQSGAGSTQKIYFTVKGDALYAIVDGKQTGTGITIAPLAQGSATEGSATEGAIQSVTMLGSNGELKFTRNTSGLNVKLPASAPTDSAYTLKITGLRMNPSTATPSGDPIPGTYTVKK